MAKNKDWDDMTPDEKADSLLRRIDYLVRDLNNSMGKLNRRISAIEAVVKPKADS